MRLRTATTVAAFATWLALCTAGAATLMASHWYTLPRPDPTDAKMTAALDSLRPAGASWLAVHVLYSSCPCSVRILDHLFARGPSETAERILLDLYDKLAALGPSIAPAGSGDTPSSLPRSGVAKDLLSALVNLGYREAVAEQTAAAAIGRLGEGAELEALLKDALTQGR